MHQVIYGSRAKGQIWYCLFLVVLCSPSRAQKVCVLFASVCLFLRIVVEVAVVVCPVPEFKYNGTVLWRGGDRDAVV